MRALVIIAGVAVAGFLGWEAFRRGLFGNAPRVVTQAGGVQRVTVTPVPTASADRIAVAFGDAAGAPAGWMVSDAAGAVRKGTAAWAAIGRLNPTVSPGLSSHEDANARAAADWLRARATTLSPDAATFAALGV